MKVLLSFPLKLNSHQSCNRNRSRITALRTAASVKNMLKLLAFKCVLNYLLLETECSEVQSYLLELLLFPIPLLKGMCHHIENEKLLKGKFGHFS